MVLEGVKILKNQQSTILLKNNLYYYRNKQETYYFYAIKNQTNSMCFFVRNTLVYCKLSVYKNDSFFLFKKAPSRAANFPELHSLKNNVKFSVLNNAKLKLAYNTNI